MSEPYATGWYSDTPRSKAEMKVGLDLLNDVMAELPGGAEGADVTIASGVITITQCLHFVETEGAAATDDLATTVTTDIPLGRLLLIRIKTAGHTVVVKHAGGLKGFMLANDADFSMTQTDQWLLCVFDSAFWVEVARCYGSLVASARAYLGLGTAALVDTGTDAGEAVVMAAGPKLPAIDGSDLTGIKERGDYFLAHDLKALGTEGGTFTSGAWRTRTLVEIIDEASVGTIAANQITLIAGNYYVCASAPAYKVIWHQARIYEISGSITSGNMVAGVITGSNAYAPSTGDLAKSWVVGKFQISDGDVTAGHNVIELQHQCSSTYAAEGFGKAFSFGPELYSVLELWRTDI